MGARLLVTREPKTDVIRMVVCPLCGTVLCDGRRIYRRILEHFQRAHGKVQIHPAPSDR